MEPESRLQVVFGDLRRAVDDVILKHQVTLEEMRATIDWLQKVADAGELTAASIFFYKTVRKATDGAPYAHPEKDGASYWEMRGSAYLADAPVRPSPAVLPMRADERGEPLIVSGTVRTTAGEPVPGAALEIWQIDADNLYSGIDTSDFLPLTIPNDSTGIPPDNLRATVIADAKGHFEFRTVLPGIETFGLNPSSPLDTLVSALRLSGQRPLHIHSLVSGDGCLPLTTQIYFDGDPLVDSTVEGAVPAAAVKTTTLHDDPADYTARGLNRPYRTLTHDYVLRPRSGSR
jgi:catechol 1,2-dioxygenase